MTRLIAAASALALLAACEPQTGATRPSAADPLAGTWRITSIGGVRTQDPISTEMTFVGLQTVSGTFGCNRFTGTYSYEGNVLFVTPGVTTRMGCAGTPGRQEDRGMRLLAMPMTVVPGSNVAILSGREGQSFALSRDGSSAAPALPTR